VTKITEDAMTEQQKKRKRVNKIKNTIVITIASWMLLSFIAIIVLIVQVVKLNNKYQKLNQNYNSVLTSQATNSSTSEEAENDDRADAQNDLSESTENKYPNVVTGIDSEDNMYHEGDSRKVYLTFDCNPSENTDAILNVLAAYNVKATFFVTGDESEEAVALYQRIVAEGHTLGMHSFSNSYSEIYASAEAFAEDTDHLSSYLKSVTGEDSVFYRFPGGSFNEISDLNMAEFVHVLNEKGIQYFDWNVSAGDAAGEYTVSDAVDNVTIGVNQYINSVVLLHDSSDKTTTTEALSSLIESLNVMGCEILPIDDSTYSVQYIKANSVN